MKTYQNVYYVSRTRYKKNHSPDRIIYGFSLNLEDMLDLARSLSHQYKKEYIVSYVQYELGKVKYKAVRARALYVARNNKLEIPFGEPSAVKSPPSLVAS